MNLKKLCYFLGLTKEKRTELSDVIYEDAKIAAKYVDLRSAGFETPKLIEAKMVKIRGSKISFDLNDQGLFEGSEIGDKVVLGYREIYASVYNYTPANFETKQFIDKTLKCYKFVGAELNQ